MGVGLNGSKKGQRDNLTTAVSPVVLPLTLSNNNSSKAIEAICP